jgi:putative ABC transport system ATP-binding protein
MTAVSAPTLLAASGLVRDYPVGDGVVHALRGIDLSIDRGQLVVVQGRSGSGKTTLLNILGGLDRPTRGSVLLDGEELTRMPESTLVNLRRNRIAFIFQSFGLIPILSAMENIEVPMRLVGRDPRERTERSRLLLELVGLTDRARHRPHELSGGQQQRVAIVRAIVAEPAVVLADEPTANVDSETAERLLAIMERLNRERKVTFIFSTHDPRVMERAHRVVRMVDGRVSEDVRR